MGTLRDIIADLFRRPTTGDDGTPQQLLQETVLFPPPPVSAQRETVVWKGKITVDFFRPALITVLVPYPNGVGMFSDELPGMFGDKPDVSCKIGGRSAQVVRLQRGESCLGFEIQLPDGVFRADLSGRTVSLEWSGSRPEITISVAKKFPEKKV